MVIIYEPPVSLLLAALATMLAVGSAWRGMRWVGRGLREADHPAGALWVVRGIRAGIVALAMSAVVGGILAAKSWVLVIAAIILAEELYETGVISLALRAGSKTGMETGIE
ncbi:MAG: hypothetical protein ACE5JI_17295 [Acidobacteriota bacterium]